MRQRQFGAEKGKRRSDRIKGKIGHTKLRCLNTPERVILLVLCPHYLVNFALVVNLHS